MSPLLVSQSNQKQLEVFLNLNHNEKDLYFYFQYRVSGHCEYWQRFRTAWNVLPQLFHQPNV